MPNCDGHFRNICDQGHGEGALAPARYRELPYEFTTTISGVDDAARGTQNRRPIQNSCGTTNALRLRPRYEHTHGRTGRPTTLRPVIVGQGMRQPVPCIGESASSSDWRIRTRPSSADELQLSSRHLTRVEPCVDAPVPRVVSPDVRSQVRRPLRVTRTHSCNYLVGSIGDIWGPRGTKPPATNLFLSITAAEGDHL
jgi:hypothetical protein